jgi:hypothetical protein
VNLGVDDTGMKIDNVEIWLGKHLGSFKDQWNAVYHHNSTDFYFKEGKDATLFALRWS